MPQAIVGALAGFTAVAGSSIAATLGIASAGYALSLGIGAATFAVLGYGIKRSLSLQDPADMGRSASYQVSVRGTQEPRTKVYGQVKVGGVIAYANSAGTENRELYMVVAHGGHLFSSFEGWWVDDKFIPASDVDTAGDGSVDTDTGGTHGLIPFSGTPVCYLRGHLGTSSQTVDAMLTAACPEWDSTKTGLGVAYTVLRADLVVGAEDRWDGGPPQSVSTLGKGAFVYDPRADGTFVGATYGVGTGTQRLAMPSTWAWSDNPALCLADYMIDSDLGPGWATARIDYDSVAVAAAACDVSAAIPTATTQKRFTCNGILSTADDCDANIAALCTSGVKVRYFKGQWHIYADVWVAPAGALVKEDLIGEFTFRAEPERDDRYNTVKGSYIDPERNYERSPFIEVQSALKASRDNNRELVKELWLPFTNNEYEAQRLAFRAIGQAGETGICSFPTFYQALTYRIGDNLTATLDEVGWAPESFRTVGWTHIDFQGIGLRLKEDDSAAYDDPAEGDYGTRTGADVIVFPRVQPATVDTPFITDGAASDVYQTTVAGPTTYSLDGQPVATATFVTDEDCVGLAIATFDASIASGTGTGQVVLRLQGSSAGTFEDTSPFDTTTRRLTQQRQHAFVAGETVSAIVIANGLAVNVTVANVTVNLRNNKK